MLEERLLAGQNVAQEKSSTDQKQNVVGQVSAIVLTVTFDSFVYPDNHFVSFLSSLYWKKIHDNGILC